MIDLNIFNMSGFTTTNPFDPQLHKRMKKKAKKKGKKK